MLDTNETICAIASPNGPSWRGVIRISGPQTISIINRIFPSAISRHGKAARTKGTVHLPAPLGALETSINCWWSPHSYTGQDSAEIHTWGAQPILQALLAVIQQAGARLAMPGEFTLRSFLAGNVDLLQAEAVLGVIDADSRAGLGVALDQLSGAISNPLKESRQELLELLADIEAGLDFVDEDIQFIEDEQVAIRLHDMSQRIANIASTMSSRGRASESPLIALQGLPNAGKSSLLNSLAGSQVAIVSEIIGTTRDPIEIRVGKGNEQWRWIDTAGCEDVSQDENLTLAIRTQAQRLAHQVIAAADVVVWCQDSQTLSGEPLLIPDRVIRVATKADLLSLAEHNAIRQSGWILTSAKSALGLDDLTSKVRELVQNRNSAGTVSSTAERCRESLQETAVGLRNAADMISQGEGHEWVAAELRIALDSLGRTTGTVFTDEILGSIFSRFCIGK